MIGGYRGGWLALALLGCAASQPAASAGRSTRAEPAAPEPTPAPSGAADVQDVATGGEAFELSDAVVHGRVTVIDFWAAWCRPCARIDRALRDLAARYPEQLSVRRAEVPSHESPIVDALLAGDSAVPQIWIFNPRGERVADLRGPGDAYLRRRLEEMLGPMTRR